MPAFIEQCNLIDPPLTNAKYTLSNLRPTLSRLDRFLFTKNWEDSFYMHYYSKTMSKITSDHFPVVLEISNLGWGPTPVRFTNHLLKDVECNKNFGTWWNNTKQDRHPRYSFMRRLKQLNI